MSGTLCSGKDMVLLTIAGNLDVRYLETLLKRCHATGTILKLLCKQLSPISAPTLGWLLVVIAILPEADVQSKPAVAEHQTAITVEV